MKLLWRVALCLCLLAVVPRASAHRIDEILEATVLSVQPQQVEASLRLIPGMQLASAVIASIDVNGDGELSEGEQRAYALHILQNLVLAADGKRLPLNLTGWSFPSPKDMLQGLGEIHLEVVATLPPGGSRRTLSLTHLRHPPDAVYLVNATVPDDPKLRILGQRRNRDQSSYELQFQAGPVAGNLPAHPWLHLPAWLELPFADLNLRGMWRSTVGQGHLLMLALLLASLLVTAVLLVMESGGGALAPLRHRLLRTLAIVTRGRGTP